MEVFTISLADTSTRGWVRR